VSIKLFDVQYQFKYNPELKLDRECMSYEDAFDRASVENNNCDTTLHSIVPHANHSVGDYIHGGEVTRVMYDGEDVLYEVDSHVVAQKSLAMYEVWSQAFSKLDENRCATFDTYADAQADACHRSRVGGINYYVKERV
jgi:hypothetical protein